MKLNISVRCAYPHVFEARENAFAKDGTKKYECTGLFESNGAVHKAILDVMKAVADQKWGAKGQRYYEEALENKNTRLIQKDADLGLMKVTARRRETDGAPAVVDQRLRAIAPSQGIPYGGCWINMRIDVWAYENNGSRGFSATLLGIQFVRDGEALGGASAASTEGFEVLETDDKEAAVSDDPWA